MTGNAPVAVPAQRLPDHRWAFRAVLLLGVCASVAANVLDARPNPISQGFAAWSPLALLLTVEMISRVPVRRRALGFVRLLATAAVAAIAAWVSYGHVAGAAARYGEHGVVPYLMPLSVDGLVVVASISLVEISGRTRAQHGAVHDGAAGAHGAAPAVRPVRDGIPRPAPGGPVSRAGRTSEARGVPVSLPRPGTPALDPAPPGAALPGAVDSLDMLGNAPRGALSPAADDPPTTGRDSGDGGAHHRSDRRRTASRVVRAQTTAAAVAHWHRTQPDLRPSEIAARIGTSERTVRRYLPSAEDNATGATPATQ